MLYELKSRIQSHTLAPASPKGCQRQAMTEPDVGLINLTPTTRPPSENGPSSRASRSPSRSLEDDTTTASADIRPFRKGWAKGERANFLDEAYHGYQAARTRGTHSVADYMTSTVNGYCARFTWWLDPPKMPSEEDLDMDDDSIPSFLLAQKAARIRRISVGIRNYLDRLSQRSAPITLMTSKQIEKDPVASLIANIGGAKVGQRRTRTAYQLWSMSNFKTALKGEVDNTVSLAGIDPQKDRIGVVQSQTQAAYDALPAHERQKYEDDSRREQEELKQRKKDNKWMPQQLSPAETLLALDKLPHSLIALFDGLRALTGWNFHVYYSGPDPRAGGQIATLSLHSGVDRSPVPADFPTAGGTEGLARRRLVEAAIGDYALRCFSTADRRAACLPDVALNQAAPSFLAWRPPSWEGALQLVKSSTTLVDTQSSKRKKSSDSQQGPRKKTSPPAADNSTQKDNKQAPAHVPSKKKARHRHPSSHKSGDGDDSSDFDIDAESPR
ncbi:hypothetical protein CYLTODRAFT_447821 [Cylindrobasidium torrendii FP15055 ss-10]|uniref:Uncharacterized protein n=1 Tax=Cylindrobasidium torrendii FP15055 ss-10 TaxID=1314674 RepID=A0A0D7ARZ3_9AGAR|nr:hypothetical protein CYLTODRAFT_447821 [Cylindrobasidium torrendii FP15055 ss-10]